MILFISVRVCTIVKTTIRETHARYALLTISTQLFFLSFSFLYLCIFSILAAVVSVDGILLRTASLFSLNVRLLKREKRGRMALAL